ncbi:MAG: amidohydrolase family protein [Kiritimatiellae bacterium]|nr:amidohydrolase family protein [Kiritimatiellia bacterium]
MIIDVHAHLFRDQAYNRAFLAECRKAGIDKICAFLSGMESTGKLADDPNRQALDLREADAESVIAFARVDPTEGEAAVTELARCVAECGMRGLKLSYGVKATDPRLFPLIEKTVELRIPILFHAFMGRPFRPERDDRNPSESDVLDIVALARRFPAAMIIMSHYNLGDWAYGIKAVKSTPNIYPCTSGSGIDSGSIEMGVGEVGADRIIFGTDNLIYAGLGKIYGAHISERERELIFGENLRRLLTKRGPLP